MHASDNRTCMDASSTPVTRRQILVFEQDDFLNSLLHLLLHREGFDVAMVTSLEGALQHIEQSPPPDMIFINHSWLIDDQPELLTLKQASPSWQQVPAVVMGNFFHENRMEQLSELGIADVMLQPFEPNDLLNLVQKYTASG